MAQPQVQSGQLESLGIFKSNFVQDRQVDVWLPNGYSSEQKYQVLYMHDGQMLWDANTTWNKQEWEVDENMGKLLEDKKVPPCIIVGVHNVEAIRHADYFPEKPFKSLKKASQDSIYALKRGTEPLFGGIQIDSDDYLKFLVKELKPYIDTHYAVYTDRSHTFVAGSSMGGLISMYAICEYPEIFGAAACISTHWPGIFSNENNPVPQAFFNYLEKHLPDPATHKIYFDYGTATLDALYEVHQLKVDEIMRTKGYTAENWETRKFEGENHSEDSWKKRLAIPFTFIMN
ncbi:alpha/beta hydrolase [Persicobacter diffluens]